MKHWNICLSAVGIPLLFQSSEMRKLMTGWLMAAHSTLWARRGFKCREWGWLNEKSVRRALSSNTWECLWQAFQEEDQYNSYHVSHIDHWLSIVIRVPNGKPMLLILKRETERGTQRGGEETNKRGIHNLEQIHFMPFKCIKGARVCTFYSLQISPLLCIKSQWILVRPIWIKSVCFMHNKDCIWSASTYLIYSVDSRPTQHPVLSSE